MPTSRGEQPSSFSGFVERNAQSPAVRPRVSAVLAAAAVLQRCDGGWIARENVGSALVTVIWIATAFTVAHSLTLGLAAFGVVRIPASVIEPLIALTILFTALNNVWPVVTRRLATVAFAFGLIHGFGFAEVLAPLSLPRSDLALALLGFNLGVELGQIAIVAGAFFVLATLRRWPGYARWILTLGSALIAIIAALWFIERVFDVSILGFSDLSGLRFADQPDFQATVRRPGHAPTKCAIRRAARACCRPSNVLQQSRSDRRIERIAGFDKGVVAVGVEHL